MGNLELNWNQRDGEFGHSRHEFTLTFASDDDVSYEVEEIYDGLKNFDNFNGGYNNIAVKSTSTLDGVKYVFFDAKGFFGFLSDRINAKKVPVRVWSRRSDYLVVGDTAKGHMLVGQRRWQANDVGAASILVATESFDQPCGILNRMGMKFMGASRQLRIWRIYLANIRGLYSSRAKASDILESSSAVSAVGPWFPEDPYPGIELP